MHEVLGVVMIRLVAVVLTEIRAFKNVKKLHLEMYGNADKSGLLSGFVPTPRFVVLSLTMGINSC